MPQFPIDKEKAAMKLQFWELMQINKARQELMLSLEDGALCDRVLTGLYGPNEREMAALYDIVSRLKPDLRQPVAAEVPACDIRGFSPPLTKAERKLLSRAKAKDVPKVRAQIEAARALIATPARA